mmetsp:Transcript_32974/g.97672  ORF Transcript_32974/g.97672 Transcript_32974/m.97672 type:complete len:703 (-) Transcript_32974:283-2391(-)
MAACAGGRSDSLSPRRLCPLCVFYSIGLRGAAFPFVRYRGSTSRGGVRTVSTHHTVGAAPAPSTRPQTTHTPTAAPRRPARGRDPDPHPPRHTSLPSLVRPEDVRFLSVPSCAHRHARSRTITKLYSLARSPPRSRRRCMLTRDRRHRSAKAPSRAVSQADAPRPSARKTRNQGAPCTRGGRPDAGPSRAARVGGGAGGSASKGKGGGTARQGRYDCAGAKVRVAAHGRGGDVAPLRQHLGEHRVHLGGAVHRLALPVAALCAHASSLEVDARERGQQPRRRARAVSNPRLASAALLAGHDRVRLLGGRGAASRPVRGRARRALRRRRVEPRVLQDGGGREALSLVDGEHAVEEVERLVRQAVLLAVPLQHRRDGALAVLLRALELVVPPVRVRRLLEREEAEQHRKEGDAARPHVGTKGVPRLGEHLRRAVGARAAAMVEHLHLVRGRGAVCALAERLVLVREPKVDHAEGEVGGEHEVLELEVAVQHAAGVHVVQSAAQRGQEGDQLSLEQRQLAAATRHAVDQVPACAVLHRDADGDASRLVPVEKDVLEADDAWVGEALQARRLQQRLVRVVDRGAADLLEDDGLAVAQRQGGLAEAALAEGAPLLDAPLAPVAFARLLLWGAAARALPERATKRDAADDEGAARHVEGHHCSLAHFNRHDPPRLVMSHKKVARRGARDLDRGRRRRRRGRHRRVRRE